MVRPEGRNFFAGSPLDRADHRRDDPHWLAAARSAEHARYVLLSGGDPLVHTAQLRLLMAPAEFAPLASAAGEATLLGTWGDSPVFALDIEAPPAVGDWAPMDIRSTGHRLDAGEAAVAAQARALSLWRRNTRFCSRCAQPLRSARAGHELRCTGCGASHFPRVDTAVIMLVHDGGDRLLLGRQAAWPAGMHSVLAGFLEPGESLEEAVAREVMEEVGVAVRDVRYHSSQPWPFPASTMVGFWAEARSLALRPNPDEIESAGWFDRQALLRPREQRPVVLPRRISIARRMIEEWLSHPAHG